MSITGHIILHKNFYQWILLVQLPLKAATRSFYFYIYLQ